jgi:hypothetical protein
VGTLAGAPHKSKERVDRRDAPFAGAAAGQRGA